MAVEVALAGLLDAGHAREPPFALLVRAEPVQRHRADEAARGILENEVAGGPARSRNRTAGCLERQQELMAHERLARPCNGVPTRRVDVANALQESRAPGRHAWASAATCCATLKRRRFCGCATCATPYRGAEVERRKKAGFTPN